MMTQTRKMAYIAILAALSFLLMLFGFPILPAASFLHIEFSILPILLGLVLLDTPSAFCILFLRSLLKLMLQNQGVETYIGLPMNMILVAIFIIGFAWIWKKKQTRYHFIVASVFATVLGTLTMMVLNLVYAMPLYAAFANFDIDKIIGGATYLATMVLPFNLLEGVLYSVAFALLLGVMQPLLKRL